VSKNNTGSLPLRGILPVMINQININTTNWLALQLEMSTERMQAAERAHNFVDCCLQTTSGVSEVS